MDIFEAVIFNDLHALNLLIDAGADVKVKDCDGNTPLHWASRKWHPTVIVNFLIAKGADVNAVNKFNETPLHMAVRSGQIDIVELLIANGAKVATIDSLGFKRVARGFIAYKSFGECYPAPKEWNVNSLKKGSIIIEDNLNTNKMENCGAGINIATKDWCLDNCSGNIWELFIPFKYIKDSKEVDNIIVVPYVSDGKIRCRYAVVIKKYRNLKIEEVFNDG